MFKGFGTKWLLIVIAVLVMGSFFAFACNTNIGHHTHVHEDGGSCQEYKITSSVRTDNDVWQAVLPFSAKPLILAVAFSLAILSVGFIFQKKIPVQVAWRIRFMSWLWARSRPFVSDSNFLPYLVPVRAA